MSIHKDNNGLQVSVAGGGQQGCHYKLTDGIASWFVSFQDGPVPECGVNGVTNEALLAVLIHRTEHLDSLFPCDENKIAIDHMKSALAAFDRRTADRISREVKDKHVE